MSSFLIFIFIGIFTGLISISVLKKLRKDAWIYLICSVVGSTVMGRFLGPFVYWHIGFTLYYMSGIIGAIFFIWIAALIKGNRSQKIMKNQDDNSSYKIAEDGTIIRVNNMRICPKCDNTFSTESKFCSFCGAKLK